MQLITDQYCSLNKDLHESHPNYGISGQKHIASVIDLSQTFQTQDILDYGCGKSTLALNLPFTINQYDPAIPKYSELPKPADIVVCTDVLEHIEPYCIEDVLNHLASLTKKVCFAVISTRPASKHLPDGRNAHLIQKNARWWLDRLWDRFEIFNFNQSKKDEFSVVMISNVKPY